LWLRA